MYCSMNECKRMLDEINTSGSWNLGAWAQDFIESLTDQVEAGKELTPKQREKLYQIYNGE